jgi:hypothetical protein
MNLDDEQLAIELPCGSKPFKCWWIFKTKWKPDGSTKFKARLIIKGYEQVPGIDYDKTYALVSKLSTLHYLLSLAATRGWIVDQMDVITAFLNLAIDNNSMFMNMLPGIDWLDSRLHKTSTVWLLKALYGLKQAARLWWQEINDFLLAQGFVLSKANPNLYLMDEVFLLLYVDDILIFNLTAKKLGDSIKTALSCHYKMTDLGRATRFLGLELEYLLHRSISICQGAYICSIVICYRLSNATSTTTPMDTHISLKNCDCEDKPTDESEKRTYLSMVGLLMYAAIGMRPDISYAVMALGRYNQSPLTMHLIAAKRVIWYLKGTVDLAIIYRKDPSLPADNLQLYSDSNWVGNLANWKSVRGCAVLTPGGTGLINWFAKKQSIIVLSMLEAEYIACSDATREALWFHQLMEDTRI